MHAFGCTLKYFSMLIQYLILQKRIFISMILLAAALSQSSGYAQSTTDKAPLYTQVVAHRGAWKQAHLPQNSIASLKEAIQLGCMGSEFDVQLTKDDSLVVNHDPVYARDTIEKSSYRQLMQTPFNNGEHLPTLYSYLATLLNRQNRSTIAVLEIKPSVISKQRAIRTTKAVLAMVQKFNALDKVIFISFDYDVLKEIHQEVPEAKTQYLNGDKSPEQLKADGITGADYHYSIFQKHPEWIRSAKENNIILNTWTVNDTATIDWLLANQFDAITTNEPELVALRARRHQQIYGHRKLVFSDEFNQTGAPDQAIWTYDTGSHGWGNHELENYTHGDTANVYIKNGLLHITALKDDSQPKGYSSVRMVQQKGFLYGRLEVRAKLPPGRGLWPAIWLLPDRPRYGGWPASGEIDLMENVGYNPDSVFFTIHTEKYNHVKHTQKSMGIYNNSLYTQFHTYGLEWSKEKLRFYMDDQQVFEFVNENSSGKDPYKSWPYNQAFHLLLNIAVGGDWGGAKGIDNNIFPASMLIDYVRIYQ